MAVVVPSRARRILRAVVVAATLTVPVAVLAYLVRAQSGPVVDLDHSAVRAGTDLTREQPVVRVVLLTWQTAFQARWVNLAVTILCLWVWRRHALRTRALWAFVTLMLTWGLNLVVKTGVQRARPVVDEAVAHAPGFSFPSGHAMNTAAAGIVVTALVWPLLGPRARAVVPLVAGLLVVLTGLDRVLLGVHYPSDVVAGVVLGCAAAGGSYLGYVGWSPVHPTELPTET
ncbi:phosphatase PAP2 family protein [Georgenia sp. EYE_87]|uniref:phosphatase PAP2 family protein n=1 Tax=Georgenia sp. EYE_87 TaxID=2853448 RepID=UPI0020068A88|nr:phosphatase PAP2 family protein [Georgenia sp. EYE_87]